MLKLILKLLSIELHNLHLIVLGSDKENVERLKGARILKISLERIYVTNIYNNKVIYLFIDNYC